MIMEDSTTKFQPEYNSSTTTDPKYKIFTDWCRDNGMVFDGVKYPTFFEGGLRGVSTTRDIKPYEGIVYVPNKLLITVAKAKEDKLLSRIIEAFPNLFIDKNVNPDYNILILSLLREKMKGIEWPDYIINQIDDQILKAMIKEAKEDVDEQWQEFYKVFQKYPNIFERITKSDFVWATQFVVSRCFSWYLPTTMLIPMVDMINHNQYDQCSTEVMHKKLEMVEDKAERLEQNYQRIRRKYDLRAVLPNTRFGKKGKKSGLVFFIDQFYPQKPYSDHRLLSDADELKYAMAIAEEILLDNDHINVWHIPDLHNDFIEEDEDSEDIEEDEDRFTEMVNDLRIRLESKKKKPTIVSKGNVPKEVIEKQKEMMKESFYQRKEKLFSSDVKKTQKASDYSQFTQSIQEYLDESTSSSESDADQYVYEQEEFPWYKSDDEDFYLVVANNRNKIIKKGEQVYLTYGNRSNRYLITWYGFSLWDNKSNSLCFRIIMDPTLVRSLGLTSNVIYKRLSESEIEKNQIEFENGKTVDLKYVSKEFKSTMNSLDYELLQYLRALLWPDYQMKTGAKNSRFSLSIPSDVKFERFIFKHYIKIYNSVLLNFKNDEIQDRQIIDNDNTDFRIKMIKICEVGYKQIASEQIRLGRVTLALLQNLRNDSEKLFKKLYMRRIPGLDKDGDQKLKTRMKISEYLKTFFISKLINVNK